MRRQNSITRRLIVWLIAGVVILWLISVTAAGVILNHELNETFDNNLSQSASRLLPLALHDIGEDENESYIKTGQADNLSFTYYVVDANDKLLLAADDVIPEQIVPAIELGYSNHIGTRYYTLADAESGITLVVIELDHHRKELIQESILTLLLPLAALVPLLGIMILIVVRTSLKPIKNLREEIASRDAHNLDVATSNEYPAELAPISVAVDELLQRLKLALNAERGFAASSAHELRTPIAGALAQAQILKRELSDHSSVERADDIEKSLSKLAQLSERLLQFSRIEAGFAKSDKVNDLSAVLAIVVDEFKRMPAAAKRISFDNPTSTTLLARIDPDAFAIAVRNLIENALAHGKNGSQVKIRLSNAQKLIVQNEADQLSQDVLDRIQKPFERDQSNAPGTGLGLSIVKAIVTQAGGAVQIQSTLDGGKSMFKATLSLPSG